MPILDDAKRTGRNTWHEKKRPWLHIALTIAVAANIVGLAALVLSYIGAV